MKHPDWAKNATLYEVNIRQYTPEGTFNAFADHLPRLRDMGIKILWLMPINPIGKVNRKGTLGSYYAISDFRTINPEYGNLDDFKALIRKIHDLDMYVLIDWVADHSAWDNFLVNEHPEYYMKDEEGNVISPVKDWTDVAGFNYNVKELREYMTESLIYWVKETNIDGFRCDVAGMVPVSFWNEAVPRIRKVKEIFMLAEWETPDMHEIAFDMTYSWDIYHLMNDIATGNKNASLIDQIWIENAHIFPADAIRLRFTSNHDENSWNGSESERMGPAVKTFAAFTFLIPGMPLIYSGQESGFAKRLAFFDKDQIDWDHYLLGYFYSTLIYLKRRNPALWCPPDGGDFKRIITDREDSVYSFCRTNGEHTVTGVFNLSNQEVSFHITSSPVSGKFRNIFSNAATEIGEGVLLHFKPWEFKILENY
ncbi:MAG: alpha-amylase family glycosyl hydrolase [Syntrophothermus sp.]